jgi:hypothetical protein
MTYLWLHRSRLRRLETGPLFFLMREGRSDDESLEVVATGGCILELLENWSPRVGVWGNPDKSWGQLRTYDVADSWVDRLTYSRCDDQTSYMNNATAKNKEVAHRTMVFVSAILQFTKERTF